MNYSPPFYYRPSRPRCQWENLKTGGIPMSSILSLLTPIAGRIQDWANLFASVERR